MNAIFSDCGTFRYLLSEPAAHQCAFVMLNPSKAGRVLNDGTVASDPTANKVREFRKSWGYSGHVIANAYALVSTDPGALLVAPDPVGPANESYLQSVATLPLVVVAWGRNIQPERAAHVERVLRQAGAELWCLGVNNDGSPKHPLYLPYSTKLQRWPGVG